MTDELTGFRKFITDATANDAQALLNRLRENNLPVEHSLFATIHDESRGGFSEDEHNEIARSLNEADRKKWEAALQAHIESQGG
jgi:DNA-binding GntR family transcriptional regulator